MEERLQLIARKALTMATEALNKVMGMEVLTKAMGMEDLIIGMKVPTENMKMVT